MNELCEIFQYIPLLFCFEFNIFPDLRNNPVSDISYFICLNLYTLCKILR